MSLPMDTHGDESIVGPDAQGSQAPQLRLQCHLHKDPRGNRPAAPTPDRMAPLHVYSQRLARKGLCPLQEIRKRSGGKAGVKETKVSGH